ncbi:hypothetical protein BDZ45DRAFT_737624 [Acephala macrosclerotiorum]|nr:hypothetical protein BDZ45DRAFT_737624 [Acephala macrosclerotiorum]
MAAIDRDSVTCCTHFQQIHVRCQILLVRQHHRSADTLSGHQEGGFAAKKNPLEILPFIHCPASLLDPTFSNAAMKENQPGKWLTTPSPYSHICIVTQSRTVECLFPPTFRNFPLIRKLELDSVEPLVHNPCMECGWWSSHIMEFLQDTREDAAYAHSCRSSASSMMFQDIIAYIQMGLGCNMQSKIFFEVRIKKGVVGTLSVYQLTLGVLMLEYSQARQQQIPTPST